MSEKTISFVDSLLNDACAQSASDIHFYPLTSQEEVNIFYRILGERKLIKTINKSLYHVLLTHLKFSANMDIGETRLPQDGTIKFITEQTETFSLRLSTLPLAASESLTIRIFSQEGKLSSTDLFLFPYQLKMMKQWLQQQSGIILFSGPTGSGKTSTMYALLETMIKEKSFQAITLEDPVERKLNDVLQVEINEQAGITYQTGLKAVLRHDPDVLLIGEIRDEITAKYAFSASLTGHLVLSTVHAKDAKGTIERLYDLGINKVDLNQALLAVASLKLLPIITKGKIIRRAAIVEILSADELRQVIAGKTILNKQVNTFQSLKEKAYLYGFINEEILYET